MSAVETPTVSQETKADVPQGKKAPRKGAVAASVMEQLARDEHEIASLRRENADLAARIVKLESQTVDADEKREPVTDEELSDAIAEIEKLNKGILAAAKAGEGTGAVAQLSLKSVLGFLPELTSEQRKQWGKARDAIRKAFSGYWKGEAGIMAALVRRAAKNPQALMKGKRNVRKTDGAITGFSVAASKMAKPLPRKGKGKTGAKPQQIAAKLPAAGNAVNPATVS